ncbi:hypothetical protein SAMN05216223_12450 [Actinacidiphila yanglinensis]|uniref:Secreted protein n=1 Tax=Actinacidiphila yanglinensis TaxID=310779 RepID=A0A1H6E1Z1_9ACTN|nr:hypothetical protein [Actinacidiphila yanglinensis]SEG91678.1 hypothetical protein SAMN05216223_12450 [Actinacidiphila yanglinensis]
MNRRSQVAAAVGVIALVGVAVGTTPAGAADRGAVASHAPRSISVSPEMVAAAKAAAAAGTNFIGNDNSIGLGVMHIKDGVYTQGAYDAVLPAEDNTEDAFGWANAAGWYLGPGYCSAQLRSDDGGADWYQQTPDLGPGQHFIGSATDYIVVMYHC